MAVIISKDVNQDNNGRMKLLIKDLDRNIIAPGDINSAKANVFDKVTNTQLGAIDRDVATYFTTDTDFNFKYILPTTDTVMVSTNLAVEEETHIFVIELDVNDGGVSIIFKEEVYFNVERLGK